MKNFLIAKCNFWKKIKTSNHKNSLVYSWKKIYRRYGDNYGKENIL
ncbi:hypothetical protein CLOSPI_01477 [Thomasclavelia spiroformis DSM 1552]|uniref:Uncharacterized protein n=1 Tax=Thomasclavelia spiroformis DSM 1552 TaxID=428126 RepID=B1C2L5_9FIRM|nr:hypothetical protein CLOSPI_01477 [Thomasclavelia spiroformis DSM 1552]